MDKLDQIIRITIGNALLAIAVNVFIIPFDLITGGTTGVALVISHFMNIPFNYIVPFVSVGTFLLGLIFLGVRFSLTTLISTILYPLFINLTTGLSTLNLVEDPFMASIMGGVCMGAALGIVFQSGASTGGMDIPPLILEKYFKINVSISMWAVDIATLLFQVPYSNLTEIILGIVLITVSMIVMNQILVSGKSAVQVLIISEKYQEIADMLMNEMDKGLTLLEGETGYTNKKEKVLVSVFNRKQLYAVEKEVSKIDPKSFMIVSNVQSVRGNRFKEWNQKGKFFI
jgi:uncharacterized membrane-anchored protein YitT (DUF2179 family)